MSEEKTLTIGELSRQTGMTVRTLRYYDKIDLLKPHAYKEGGHRLYGPVEIVRLQQIQSLKYIGLTLKEIAGILNKSHISGDALKHAIKATKTELLARQEEISHTIQQLERMQTFILEEEQVDLKLFCFMIHSALWEEENLEDFLKTEDGSYPIHSSKRESLDNTFYQLFLQFKQLAASNASPYSEQARKLAKQIKKQTSSLMIVLPDHPVPSENLLNPFTENEQSLLRTMLREGD